MKKAGILAGVIAVGLALLLGGMYVSSKSSKNESSMVEQTVSPSAQSSEIAADATVLDVRTPEEYSVSHAKQAVNLPLQSIEAGELPDADKNETIYLYCRSGNRSAQAATILKQAGYTNIIDLGGTAGAEAAGLEFTQS